MKIEGTKKGIYQIGSDGHPFGIVFISSKRLTEKQLDREVDFMLGQWEKFGVPRFYKKGRKK